MPHSEPAVFAVAPDVIAAFDLVEPTLTAEVDAEVTP
jgi:hypothetical protein